MKIILARHGESTSDVEDRYGGDYDDELTLKGKEQAKGLATNLSDKKINLIYSSPKKRAMQAAEIISKKIGVQIKVESDLRERNNYGVLTGLIKKEAKEKFPSEVKEFETNSPTHKVKGSEKFENFKKRVEKSFDTISKNENETILLITHAGPIRRIIAQTMGREVESIKECGNMEIEKIDGKYYLNKLEGVILKEIESKQIIQITKQIYEKYSVPTNVRRHMIQVAAVAELLCEKSKKKTNKEDIIAAALIHDLGNIVKMNFDDKEKIKLLDLNDRKQLSFLRIKQKEFLQRYGSNDGMANQKIVEEIGVNQKVNYLFKHKALERETDQKWKNNLDLMIFTYADLRVAPNGVTTLKNRLAEFAKRYDLKSDKKKWEYSQAFCIFADDLEKTLFKNLLIKPKDITTLSIKKYFEKYEGAVL
jgi:broad specificity phosphatase PhoE/uncharacterized protein (UPF0147 family)